MFANNRCHHHRGITLLSHACNVIQISDTNTHTHTHTTWESPLSLAFGVGNDTKISYNKDTYMTQVGGSVCVFLLS